MPEPLILGESLLVNSVKLVITQAPCLYPPGERPTFRRQKYFKHRLNIKKSEWRERGAQLKSIKSNEDAKIENVSPFGGSILSTAFLS